MTTPEPTALAPGRTIARLLADALVASGVDVAFTVPGESFLPLLDALDARGIRVIAARHEGAAAFMAEAWGQLTGRPAVVVGTRAVGAANMAIGIVTARADSSPMVAIVGQVRRDRLGREAFQEADVAGSVGRLAKWAVEIRDPEVAPGAIEEALHRVVDGRPGPVLISIPEDVFDETTGDARFSGSTRPPERRAPEPAIPRVSAVLRLLAAGRRPVIIAGAGVLRSRGTRDLVRLAETLEVPVVAAWRRGDAFPNDHRLYLGMAGFGAPDTVRERLADADAILVLGSRLSEVTTFGYTIPAAGARWAHVDREPIAAAEGSGQGPAIALTADADAFLRAALRAVAGAVHEKASYDARRTANAADRAAYLAAAAVADGPSDDAGVHPGKAVAALQSALPAAAIVTTDAGNFAGWLARGFRFRRPATFLGPTSGAMGYALPAAIAAALWAPDRAVVAVAGDGGFAMTMADLETAVRLRLPVVAVVFDDRRYGMIRDHQVRGGHGTVATDLGPVDFAAAARALGARGVTVARDEDLAPAFAEAVRAGEPTVVHLLLDPAWVAVGRREEVVTAVEEVVTVEVSEDGTVEAVDVIEVTETTTIVEDASGAVVEVVDVTETLEVAEDAGGDLVVVDDVVVTDAVAGDHAGAVEAAVVTEGDESPAGSEPVAESEPDAEGDDLAAEPGPEPVAEGDDLVAGADAAAEAAALTDDPAAGA
ncbi:MAG: thiamine pyrophosphate-binding protein [Chloroflexi bacterium]|nr:thiamine pyrophosphate-binding protein [Chloroflexota bacterium]